MKRELKGMEKYWKLVFKKIREKKKYRKERKKILL